jgi:DNA invertase Pin-like site-specific DNA recombinase
MVWKLDRLGWSLREVLTLLQEKGVEFVSLHDHINLKKCSCP